MVKGEDERNVISKRRKYNMVQRREEREGEQEKRKNVKEGKCSDEKEQIQRRKKK